MYMLLCSRVAEQVSRPMTPESALSLDNRYMAYGPFHSLDETRTYRECDDGIRGCTGHHIILRLER